MPKNQPVVRAEPNRSANILPIDEAQSLDLGNGVTGRYGLVPVDNVLENPDTVRTHRKRQIEKVARSMDVSGPLAPAVVDERLMLLAGHARLAACRLRGMLSIPVVQVLGLTQARKRAFLLSDNRIGEDAGWNREKLVSQLPELRVLLADDGFTLEDTGFEIAELDIMSEEFGEGQDPDDGPHPAGPPVLRTGDLLTLGNHRLLVGDARDPADLHRLCAGRTAAAAFLDPPYNVRVRDIVGRGRVQHTEFAMASGEMPRDEFVAFLKTVLGNVAQVSTSGAVHFVCMDRKHIRDLLEAGEVVYGVDNNLDLIVWNKTNAGQGGLYRQQHELIGVFRVGDEPHRNNVQMGRFGRNRTNVWTYAGANTFRAGRMDDLAAHPSTLR